MLTTEVARRQRLRAFKNKFSQRIDLEEIIIVVCRFTGYSPNMIVGSSYNKGVIEAKRFISYLAFRIYSIDCQRISQRIKFSRSSIWGSSGAMEKRMKNDESLAYDVARIRMMLK